MKYIFIVFILILFVFSFTSIKGALPAGFEEEAVFEGLKNPVAVRFAPNGEVFIAEKSGIIKRYDSIADTTPELFADLRTNVFNYWDRGLLGLAIHPNWPEVRHVYVAYTFDGDIGGEAPKWGNPGADSDTCPVNPVGDGCEASGRLSRLSIETGAVKESVLIEDWCQVFPSHSVGDLKFGPEGALYMSAGDGASFGTADWGQLGVPVNFCNDPPGEGGAFRTQDLLTSLDPAGLNGSIIRLDADSDLNGGGFADPFPDNPLIGSKDLNEKRIIGFGLRNPYRFTLRPGTNELWIGDVGWTAFEEINRIADPTQKAVNFGWPCYEGNGVQKSYEQLSLCQVLISLGTVTAPYFTYNHKEAIAPGDTCGSGGSSVTGLTFYDSDNYPLEYHHALFGADYSRNCIWVMMADVNGLPDINNRKTFLAGATNPVDLQAGPNGDLYYVDIWGGAVKRIRFSSGNQPTARLTATPLKGHPPLEVTLDGSASIDPNGDPIEISWDLDNDGRFEDGTGPVIKHVFGLGTHAILMQARDSDGNVSFAKATITVENLPPTATILSPTASVQWAVNDVIAFSGEGKWKEGSPLPDSALRWNLNLLHCESKDHCHTHLISTWEGVASGSFVAPDHEYPSFLELVLIAKSPDGTEGRALQLIEPRTVRLKLNTSPSGLQLLLNGQPIKAPYTGEAIVGSSLLLEAPSPQNKGTGIYLWNSWTDSADEHRNIIVPDKRLSYTAKFKKNKAPKSKFTSSVSPARGRAPLTVTFDGSASYDPEGDTLTYSWQFDDGALATGPVVTHTFYESGSKKVKLTVSDPHGRTMTKSMTVRIY